MGVASERQLVIVERNWEGVHVEQEGKEKDKVHNSSTNIPSPDP
jgi:hypothetical protein